MDTLEKIKKDRWVMSKVISIIDNGLPEAEEILGKIGATPPEALVIGITGPSGAGKSTLLGRLVEEWVKDGESVGILAIDPSSPLSGGAILGDRLRMKELFLNKNVFIRSLGTKKGVGGINPTTADAVKVLSFAGFKTIFIETAGIGQSEVEVMNVADCVVLVLTPDYGDSIQTMKAGIIEIADIFAVNKSDIYDADFFIRELEEVISSKLSLNSEGSSPDLWKRAVLKISSKKGEGIKELKRVIKDFEKFLRSNDLLLKRRYKKRMKELISLITVDLSRKLAQAIENEKLKDVKDMLMSGVSITKIKKILEEKDEFKEIF